MFRAHGAHHQERQILSTCSQLGHQHRMIVTGGCIDAICLSRWWVPCARNMQRVIIKYIERNLCVTLVIYQESPVVIYKLIKGKGKSLQCDVKT
jgi:hypothetical protein